MIGHQQTGFLRDIIVVADFREGYRFDLPNGVRGCLAVLDDRGAVIAQGRELATASRKAAIDLFRSFLAGTAHVPVISPPIGSVVVKATIPFGFFPEVNGHRSMFAVLGQSGEIVTAGEEVAREIKAVAINLFRDFLKARGHLREVPQPSPVGTGSDRHGLDAAATLRRD